MSLANLGSHWWVILIIVVLLFGAPKLPALAKSMGQSMRIFKNEIKTGKEEDAAAAPVQNVAPVQESPVALPGRPVLGRADQVVPSSWTERLCSVIARPLMVRRLRSSMRCAPSDMRRSSARGLRLGISPFQKGEVRTSRCCRRRRTSRSRTSRW